MGRSENVEEDTCERDMRRSWGEGGRDGKLGRRGRGGGEEDSSELGRRGKSLWSVVAFYLPGGVAVNCVYS